MTDHSATASCGFRYAQFSIWQVIQYAVYLCLLLINVALTSAMEPSVQQNLESGTICRRTSDSRTCHTASFRQSLKSFIFKHWDQNAVWTSLIWLHFRNTLIYLISYFHIPHSFKWTGWTLTLASINIVLVLLLYRHHCFLFLLAASYLPMCDTPVHVDLDIWPWFDLTLTDDSVPTTSRRVRSDCELPNSRERAEGEGAAGIAGRHWTRIHEHQPRGLHRLCQVCHTCWHTGWSENSMVAKGAADRP